LAQLKMGTCGFDAGQVAVEFCGEAGRSQIIERAIERQGAEEGVGRPVPPSSHHSVSVMRGS
jgi:hypothetical protein